MNSYSKTNATKTNTTKQNNKPFCLVCKNAGKTEKEYSNHYTKSSTEKNAVITCPTILNNICTYCKNKGHFKSSCPILIEKEKEKEKEKAVREYNEKKQTVARPSQNAPKNMFEMLNEPSNQQHKTKITKITKEELFPALVPENKIKKETPGATISYAKVAEKYIPLKEVTASSAPEKKEKIFRIKNVGLHNLHHDWSDDNYWTDDEFDEEDEVNYMEDSTSITSRETDNNDGSYIKIDNNHKKPVYSLLLPPDYIGTDSNINWW